MELHSPVVIVSGLPRSGTSLLMQMLQAGGAPLLTDEKRKPDEHNLRGYFEFTPVKKLRQDAAWVSLAIRKAVKVVSPLLVDLPSGFQYHVLLIERPLLEVIASQQAMLADKENTEPSVSEENLLQIYTRHQAEISQRIESRADMMVHKVNHGQLIVSPAEIVPGIAEFLQPVWPEITLNQDAMIRAIDPQLYRTRR